MKPDKKQNNPIAFGRRSRIFSIDKTTVLKLYDQNFPQEKVAEEYRITVEIARQTPLLVPKPLKLVGKGIYYERIRGIALMDLFQKKPLSYFTYGKILSSIHHRIHREMVKKIPSQEQAFGQLIEKSKRLAAGDKHELLFILNEPKDRRLCHGDFHHGNIIKTPEGKYYLLDWMDAFVGDPGLDVALTAVNASVSTAPPHVPYLYRQAYEFLKRILTLDRRYLNLYRREPEASWRKYLLLAAGIHLTRFEGPDCSYHRRYFDRQTKLN